MIKVRYYVPFLAVVMLVGILLFQGWQLRALMDDRALNFSRESLHSLAARAQSSLGNRFAKGDMVAVRQAMAEIYLFKRETEAFLIGDGGQVIAADRLGYDGANIKSLPIELDPAMLASARTSLQGQVVINASKTALTAYYPVSLSREDEEPFRKVGVLVINLHLGQLQGEVTKFVRSSILQSLLVVLLLAGTVSVIVHFVLVRRVKSFMDVSNRYAAGDLNARNLNPGNDEIGQVARAFNRVADIVAEKQARLERSQANLLELNRTLEERVASRTEALSRQIEDRQKAEAEALENQHELEAIFDLAPDGIVLINRAGILQKINLAAERLFGIPQGDAPGRNVNILMPEPHRTAHDSYLRNYEQTGVRKVIGFEREVEAARSDGTLFPCALSVSEFTLRGETHYVGMIRDISERKAAAEAMHQAQQRLLASEKMAALGGLVAGVAHEINTPVGVSVTAVTHLREQIEAFADLYHGGKMKRSHLDSLLTMNTEATQIIFDNLVRASDLIRSFKEIAVDQTGDDVRTIKLDEYLQRVLTSLQPQFKNRPVRVSHAVDPAALVVRLPAGPLAQVVSNLVLNALAHAFGPDDDGEIRIDAVRKGSGITVTCTDTGRGMAQDVLARIFEPFFTTKRGQGGSGLGMHIVYNIVTQKFGGSISCKSAPGEGTRFTISIPECDPRESSEESGT